MVLLNLNAMICFALIWGITYGLRYAIPTMSPLVDAYVTPLLFVVIGWLAEKADLRPRVFFIPLWLAGIVLIFHATYIYTGDLYFWPLVVVGVIGLYIFMRARKTRNIGNSSETGAADSGSADHSC